ncbi:MAG: helix-turn-helix transcriptional regulator [Candidatus Saccharibacteria bacterium]|nr:helix-turn-helix transcriptional regulator [Candidatus Saccharibacteria bacterium]
MKLNYEDKLLIDWEDIFKQGLLTFWTFVALQDAELEVSKIKTRVEHLTNNSYTATEQSFYRVLRKHYDLELVNLREVANNNGPKLKLYTLSPLGMRLLKSFAARNISLFDQLAVNSLYKKGN